MTKIFIKISLQILEKHAKKLKNFEGNNVN